MSYQHCFSHKSKASYRLLWKTTSPVRHRPSVSDPTALIQNKVSFPWVYSALVLIWLWVLYIDSYLSMDISSVFLNRAYAKSSKCTLWRLLSAKTSPMLKMKYFKILGLSPVFRRYQVQQANTKPVSWLSNGCTSRIFSKCNYIT